MMTRKKPPPCEACGSSDVLPIFYGLPDAELMSRDGVDMSIGGCIVRGDDPEWACRACGYRFPPYASDEHA